MPEVPPNSNSDTSSDGLGAFADIFCASAPSVFLANLQSRDCCRHQESKASRHREVGSAWLLGSVSRLLPPAPMLWSVRQLQPWPPGEWLPLCSHYAHRETEAQRLAPLALSRGRAVIKLVKGRLVLMFLSTWGWGHDTLCPLCPSSMRSSLERHQEGSPWLQGARCLAHGPLWALFFSPENQAVGLVLAAGHMFQPKLHEDPREECGAAPVAHPPS